MTPEDLTMADREADLRAALSKAIMLADGEAVDAAGLLIEAVADFLDIPHASIRVGEPLPEDA